MGSPITPGGAIPVQEPWARLRHSSQETPARSEAATCECRVVHLRLQEVAIPERGLARCPAARIEGQRRARTRALRLHRARFSVEPPAAKLLALDFLLMCAAGFQKLVEEEGKAAITLLRRDVI